MIALEESARIVADTARSWLGKENVVAALSEPIDDAFGRDALRVTIVIKPEAVPKLEGDDLIEALVRIQERLQGAGEERFASVRYLTQQDLVDDVDPES